MWGFLAEILIGMLPGRVQAWLFMLGIFGLAVFFSWVLWD